MRILADEATVNAALNRPLQSVAYPMNAFNVARLPSLLVLILCASPHVVHAQTPEVPDWAQPGSATHKQVPPPADFHRPTTTFDTPIGIFEGQSDIGTAVVPGSAAYDDATKQYTINSAGYNIWYTRDEFRYLWKKISGDFSLAANITFPKADGYGDRKVVFVVRQDLTDDAKEVMTALHGAGLIHLAQRPDKGDNIREDYRLDASDAIGHGAAPRIGIEKHGDSFTLLVSLSGEPLHQVGPPAELHLTAPFYVGIGFTSHLPATSDTAVVSKVEFKHDTDTTP